MRPFRNFKNVNMFRIYSSIKYTAQRITFTAFQGNFASTFFLKDDSIFDECNIFEKLRVHIYSKPIPFHTSKKCWFYNFLHYSFINRSSVYFSGKPDRPRDVETICNIKSAKIQWMSSFNGGDSQTFTVYAILARQEASRSEPVHDKGENKLHNTQLFNLQPSTKYAFHVVAQNKHGNISSEKRECKTLEGMSF